MITDPAVQLLLNSLAAQVDTLVEELSELQGMVTELQRQSAAGTEPLPTLLFIPLGALDLSGQ